MADSSTEPPPTAINTVLKTFLAGGVAGCCAKTTVAPFDRVKILLQAHNKHYKNLGVFSTVTTVLNTEGSQGLFKGNGVQMLRIFPYAAIQFTSYEHYKKKLKELFGTSNLTKLAAGSLAGMTAVLMTYPLDVIRARLAFQVKGEHIYFGIVHAFSKIFYKEGGIRGLYKGIVPTMLGMAPYAGLSFFSFETMKAFALERTDNLWKYCSTHKDKRVLTMPANLLIGGLSGAIAQTVSYPLDVARRKMQLALMLPESHRFRTWYSTLGVCIKEHGFRKGLYRGLSVNYIKVTPMIAVSFSVYEFMKEFLEVDTHESRAR